MASEIKKPIKSKNFYGLIVDEERATVLSCLFATCFLVEPILEKNLKEFGVEKAFQNLLEEISKKEHKLGWCENPLCKHDYQEEEKKEEK